MVARMTEPPWLSEQEQKAWRSMRVMQDGLAEFLERQLRTRNGISNADYQVLANLSEAPEGHLRSFELGKLLQWEKSRLSQHLGRMQNRGLIIRERSLVDQRGAVISITDEGLALVKKAARQHAADVRKAFIDHLTATELKTLITIGNKVRRVLTESEQ
jgi:DNA-binding MarR family transcriptional regulator